MKHVIIIAIAVVLVFVTVFVVQFIDEFETFNCITTCDMPKITIAGKIW